MTQKPLALIIILCTAVICVNIQWATHWIHAGAVNIYLDVLPTWILTAIIVYVFNKMP